MNHTPGPWRAVNRSLDGADDPFLGWDVEGPPAAERGMFQRREDAYLAAAAPELLEACQNLLRAIDSDFPTDEARDTLTAIYCTSAEKVIAKAEGCEP